MTCPATLDNRATEPRWLRPGVQTGFLITSLLIGWQFHRFVLWLADPVSIPPTRPAGVEAWLSISNLMNLIYWMRTGEPSWIHPADLVLFVLILAISFLFGRGFCSWVCPVGTGAEWAHRIGAWTFGGNLRIHRWIDLPHSPSALSNDQNKPLSVHPPEDRTVHSNPHSGPATPP